MRVPRVLLALFVLVVIGSTTSATASSDEVSPAQDNPKGCVTATQGSEDGCGAQGRNNFPGNAGHKPPITACKTAKANTGSVVTRILPAGPLRSDKTLAFISGACVYLPPGYDKSTTIRYPVVYLLHGGGGDESDWVTLGNARAILDASYATDHRNAVIAVMPDGRDAQWYDYYNRHFLIETYVLNYLVPFVDRHFRTFNDRMGRAVVGLSNGGYGAMEFAAKRPDLFGVAGSMSGNVGGRAFGDLGTPIAPGGPAFQEAGSYYYGNNPIDLASNLDGVDLIMDWGASCAQADISIDLCGTWAFEQSFRYDNQNLHDTLVADAHRGLLDYRETDGSHAWRWWTKWLKERDLPFLLSRLWNPTAAKMSSSTIPSSFRYRSIANSFGIWGYRFDIGKGRASEFLDVSNVKTVGMVMRGSGLVLVTTPPRYKANTKYTITGAGPEPIHTLSDSTGRLRFTVDLGPAHTDEEYSLPGRIAEAQGNYFTTDYVVITQR